EGRGSGPPGRSLYRRDQRGGEGTAEGDDDRRPRLPRQLQGHVSLRRRLRLGRRAFLWRDQRRSFPARVRHASRRRLRTASLRAREQERGARTGELENPAARIDRWTEAP